MDCRAGRGSKRHGQGRQGRQGRHVCRVGDAVRSGVLQAARALRSRTALRGVPLGPRWVGAGSLLTAYLCLQPPPPRTRSVHTHAHLAGAFRACGDVDPAPARGALAAQGAHVALSTLRAHVALPVGVGVGAGVRGAAGVNKRAHVRVQCRTEYRFAHAVRRKPVQDEHQSMHML